MSININTPTTIPRVVGNLEAISAQLLDNDGSAINLTGLSLTFRMVLIADGSVKVDDETADIVTAATGEVAYSPQATDVDTAGLYAMYFEDNSSPARRWPFDGAIFRLLLMAENVALAR